MQNRGCGADRFVAHCWANNFVNGSTDLDIKLMNNSIKKSFKVQ